jgi:hypothetical protein
LVEEEVAWLEHLRWVLALDELKEQVDWPEVDAGSPVADVQKHLLKLSRMMVAL